MPLETFPTVLALLTALTLYVRKWSEAQYPLNENKQETSPWRQNDILKPLGKTSFSMAIIIQRSRKSCLRPALTLMYKHIATFLVQSKIILKDHYSFIKRTWRSQGSTWSALSLLILPNSPKISQNSEENLLCFWELFIKLEAQCKKEKKKRWRKRKTMFYGRSQRHCGTTYNPTVAPEVVTGGGKPQGKSQLTYSDPIGILRQETNRGGSS